MPIQLKRPLLLAVTLVLILSLFACAKPETSASHASEQNASSVKVSENQDEEAQAWLAEQSTGQKADGRVALTINDKQIRVEYADSPEERQLGLMYRRQLCEDCGMLFKFDYPRIASIWMKNTFIPLDLAYIDANGKIIDIKGLQAHDLTSVKSSSLALYALEMNQGWFAKQDIQVGDRVEQLP